MKQTLDKTAPDDYSLTFLDAVDKGNSYPLTDAFLVLNTSARVLERQALIPNRAGRHDYQKKLRPGFFR